MPRFFILLCLSVLCTTPAYSVEQFSYKILNKKPQDRANFVQGLEILEGELSSKDAFKRQQTSVRMARTK